jgi:hypothetical protein
MDRTHLRERVLRDQVNRSRLGRPATADVGHSHHPAAAAHKPRSASAASPRSCVAAFAVRRLLLSIAAITALRCRSKDEDCSTVVHDAPQPVMAVSTGSTAAQSRGVSLHLDPAACSAGTRVL